MKCGLAEQADANSDSGNDAIGDPQETNDRGLRRIGLEIRDPNGLRVAGQGVVRSPRTGHGGVLIVPETRTGGIQCLLGLASM
jgi:hypothetical protein